MKMSFFSLLVDSLNSCVLKRCSNKILFLDVLFFSLHEKRMYLFASADQNWCFPIKGTVLVITTPLTLPTLPTRHNRVMKSSKLEKMISGKVKRLEGYLSNFATGSLKFPFFSKWPFLLIWRFLFFIWNICQEYHPPTPPPSAQWRN